MPINYAKYPEDWQEKRLRILDRADNKCEVCGLNNYNFIHSLKVGDTKKEWYEDFEDAKNRALEIGWEKKHIEPNPEPIIRPVKVVLAIAHLDHDEENYSVKDERLMAMCQKCHNWYDAKEKSDRGLNKK